jgi:glyoxylase-like metal-dependent hydrolase (beta-lactamase superfamily II)
MSLVRRCFLVGALALAIPAAGRAQSALYSDSLLPALRRAATAVPGALPQAVGVLAFNWSRGLASGSVEGAPDDSVGRANVVFQIRYPGGWIMVDAGMDKEIANNPPRFSQERYDRVQLALKDARLIVITHEHYDHIEGALRSPYLAQIQPKTLLNRAQVQTLMTGSNPGNIKLDSAGAARFIVVDYDGLLPVAPGVVLIKAPGHTPGSQMVYVRTAAGREMVLAGDVAWAMAGVENDRQKPEAVSQRLHEDRQQIAPQVAWLHGLAAQHVAVVVSHDDASVTGLVRQGVLAGDVDLRNP